MTAPSLPWRLDVLRRLQEPGAPRVFSPTDLAEWLDGQGLAIQRRSLFLALNEWTRAKTMDRLGHGIYLNRLIRPTVRMEEAAPRLRAGAVISLQRVLGEAGVLNNPSHWVTAVVPTTAGRNAGQWVDEGEARVFQFASMAPEYFPDPNGALGEDAYDRHAPVPTATPEKALLDWIYLSQNTIRGGRPPPPHGDLDEGMLDESRLARLAAGLGLEDAYAHWKAQGMSARSAQHPARRRKFS